MFGAWARSYACQWFVFRLPWRKGFLCVFTLSIHFPDRLNPHPRVTRVSWSLSQLRDKQPFTRPFTPAVNLECSISLFFWLHHHWNNELEQVYKLCSKKNSLKLPKHIKHQQGNYINVVLWRRLASKQRLFTTLRKSRYDTNEISLNKYEWEMCSDE